MRKFLPAVAILIMPLLVNAQKRQVQDKMEKEYGEPGLEKLEGWMANMMNVKVADEYSFPLSITMHITSYKSEKKKDEMDIRYFINPGKASYATDFSEKKNKKNMLFIYDVDANAMIMLNEDEKTGMALNMNGFMSKEMIEERNKKVEGKAAPNDNFSCKKTGKSKTINGYKCEEFVCTDAERDTRTEVWVTDKLNVNIAQSAGRGPLSAFFSGTGRMSGMMMEAHMYKNDKLETDMLVTEVNDKANLVVKTTDYKMNNMH